MQTEVSGQAIPAAVAGDQQGVLHRADEADTVDELGLRMRVRTDAHLEERDHVLAAVGQRAESAGEHVLVDEGDRPERTARDEHRTLIEVLAGDLRVAFGTEEHRIRQAKTHETQGRGAIIEGAERRTAEVGELDLDAAGADLVDERREEAIDAVAGIERGVDEVDPDRAERVLLAARVLVPEAEMKDDFARLGSRLVLEADPDPGVSLPLAVMRRRRDRVGEGEEAGGRAALGLQPVDQQDVFVIEHLLEALPGNVALRVAVDGVADPHVIGGHALRHGPGGAACLEEVADDLLTGPDLGEGAVGGTVQVDGQGLAGGGGTGR